MSSAEWVHLRSGAVDFPGDLLRAGSSNCEGGSPSFAGPLGVAQGLSKLRRVSPSFAGGGLSQPASPAVPSKAAPYRCPLRTPGGPDPAGTHAMDRNPRSRVGKLDPESTDPEGGLTPASTKAFCQRAGLRCGQSSTPGSRPGSRGRPLCSRAPPMSDNVRYVAHRAVLSR